jgi:hypothetical protein
MGSADALIPPTSISELPIGLGDLGGGEELFAMTAFLHFVAFFESGLHFNTRNKFPCLT